MKAKISKERLDELVAKGCLTKEQRNWVKVSQERAAERFEILYNTYIDKLARWDELEEKGRNGKQSEKALEKAMDNLRQFGQEHNIEVESLFSCEDCLAEYLQLCIQLAKSQLQVYCKAYGKVTEEEEKEFKFIGQVAIDSGQVEMGDCGNIQLCVPTENGDGLYPVFQSSDGKAILIDISIEAQKDGGDFVLYTRQRAKTAEYLKEKEAAYELEVKRCQT